MHVIELNDHELALYSGEGKQLKSEPAAAAVIGQELVFGTQALSQGRIHPQGFNNRYLGSTTAEPLPSPIGPAHNFADLIYQHLATYELNGETLVILTPAHFTNEQLGLMLGICQELGIAVRGFVDSPLMQSMAGVAESRFNILDIEWHRLTLTTVTQDEGYTSVENNKVWEGRGLNHLIEGWMGVIADEFMHRTRFDPLHRGDTEQQLFQQTYAWLTQDFNARIVISGSENDRELEIQRERVAEKTQQRLEGLDIDPNVPLFLTARAQSVPDLHEILRRGHQSVNRLTGDWTSYLEEVCQELPTDRVTRLTKTASRASSVAPVIDAPVQELATHLLDEDHSALPLSAFAGLDQTITVGQSVSHENKTYVAIKVK